NEQTTHGHLFIVEFLFRSFDAEPCNFNSGNIKPVEMQDFKQHLIATIRDIMLGREITKHEYDLTGQWYFEDIQFSFAEYRYLQQLTISRQFLTIFIFFINHTNPSRRNPPVKQLLQLHGDPNHLLLLVLIFMNNRWM